MPKSGYFDVVFGVDGDLTPVPDGVQPDGSISYTQGWGPYYSQDPTVDPGTALLIDRAQTNQMFNDLTVAVQNQQQGSAPPFIDSTMTSDGNPFSYPKYAQVTLSDVRYQSLQDANTDTPPSSKWAVLDVGSSGIPDSNETGTNYAPVGGDLGHIITRSNSATPMVDTLPGTSGALAAAWWALIQNTDASALLTVGVGSGGSIAVGASPTANTFIVKPGETWEVISYGAGAYTAFQLAPATVPAGSLAGSARKLAGVYASNATATFTADAVTVWDTGGNSANLLSFNKTLNTATSGPGGLDAAVASSTWYAVYAIAKPDGTQNIIGSSSFTGATLSGGYTKQALIGAFKTDGSSNIIGFVQYGREWSYVVGSNLAGYPAMASGSTSSAWSATAVAAFAPSIASSVKVSLSTQNTGNGQFASVAPNSTFAFGPNHSPATPLPPMFWDNGSNNQAYGGVVEIFLESSNIYYASSTSASGLLACGFQLNL